MLGYYSGCCCGLAAVATATTLLNKPEVGPEVGLGTVDPGTAVPMSLNIGETVRTKGDTIRRCAGVQYDNRDTLVGVRNGANHTHMNVGREWGVNWKRLAVGEADEWGSDREKTTLQPGIAPLSSEYVDSGSVGAWTVLQMFFGVRNEACPTVLREHLRCVHGASTNCVRYLQRLATMYVCSRLTSERYEMTSFRIHAPPPYHKVNSLADLDVGMQLGPGGTQFVPYIQPTGMGVLGELDILRAAASRELTIVLPTGPELMPIWPDLGLVHILLHGDDYFGDDGGQPTNEVQIQVGPGDIWSTAVIFATQYASIEIWRELVETTATLVVQPINLGNHHVLTGLSSEMIALPRSNMGPLAAAPLFLHRNTSSADHKQPDKDDLWERSTRKAMLISLSYRYYSKTGPVALIRRMREKNQGHLAEFAKVARLPEIWYYAQHYLQQLGIQGQLGRIISTLHPGTLSDKQIIAQWYNNNATSIQWEELITRMGKIGAESSMLSMMYPTPVRDGYINQWFGSRIDTAFGAARDLGGLCSFAGVEFNIKISRPSGEIDLAPFVVDKNYAGRALDGTFMKCENRLNYVGEVVARVTTAENYLTAKDKEHCRFCLVWYVQST